MAWRIFVYRYDRLLSRLGAIARFVMPVWYGMVAVAALAFFSFFPVFADSRPTGLEAIGADKPQREILLDFDGDQDLCAVLLAQARARWKEKGSTCSVPYADRARGISKPDWQKVDVDTHMDVFMRIVEAKPNYYAGTFLGATGLERRRKQKELEKSNKLAEFILATQLDDIVRLFKTGQGSLEMAVIDIDNSGVKESVYRLTNASFQKHTGWETLPCVPIDKEPRQNPYPAYRIFVDAGAVPQFGTFNNLPFSDVFFYRGRTYTVLQDGMNPYIMVSEQKFEGGRPITFSLPVCSIRAKIQ